MKIFFTGSLNVTNNYKQRYQLIINTLIKARHEVISLETGSYESLFSKRSIEYQKLNPNELHYLWLKKAIQSADCSIVECSKNGFSLGHIATLSILYNKPVLCLSDNNDYSQAILDPKFYAHKYSEADDLSKTILNFLTIVKNKHLSIRKNIYITPDNDNFLGWLSKKDNTNASEIIRGTIEQLKKKNPEYSK